MCKFIGFPWVFRCTEKSIQAIPTIKFIGTVKTLLIFRKANYDVINTKISEINWKELLYEDCIESNTDKFYASLNEIISENVP